MVAGTCVLREKGTPIATYDAGRPIARYTPSPEPQPITVIVTVPPELVRQVREVRQVQAMVAQTLPEPKVSASNSST